MTDEHQGPCGKYCAVVDECDARGRRIAALEAALKPFSHTASIIPNNCEDDFRVHTTFAAGDLRAARAALEGEND